MSGRRLALVTGFALLWLFVATNFALHREGARLAPFAVTTLALAAAIWERARYRPRVQPGAAKQPTGERFYDLVSGELTTVFYDAATGRREYRS